MHVHLLNDVAAIATPLQISKVEWVWLKSEGIVQCPASSMEQNLTFALADSDGTLSPDTYTKQEQDVDKAEAVATRNDHAGALGESIGSKLSVLLNKAKNKLASYCCRREVIS